MEVKINVDKQKLKVTTNLKTFVSGTQEFIKFTFNFMDSTWNDLTIFAQFRQGDKAYNVYLDDNKSVYLPHEVEPGECLLTLHGAYDKVIAITDSLKLTIDANKLIADASSTEITQDLYQQLVTRIDDLDAGSETASNTINEIYNKFNTIFSTSYELTTNYTEEENWTIDSVSSVLVGNMLRIMFVATRSEAVTGNVANENICTFSIPHDGKIKEAWSVGFSSAANGATSSFQTGSLTNSDNVLSVPIILGATATSSSSFSGAFIIPVTVDISAY